MHRNDFSLFQQIQNREITGNKVNTSKYISQHDAEVNKLIKNFEKEKNLISKLAYLDELKRFAVLGIDSGINFFNIPLFKSFHSRELNDAFNLACEEIGYYTSNPALLVKLITALPALMDITWIHNFPAFKKA